MAVSDFILVLDKVPGETQDKVFKAKNGIDIASFSWGVSNASNSALGGGLGRGKASFSDLSFTMPVNKASPKIGEFCASGGHLGSASLHVRKSGKDGEPVEYYTITLTDVVITSYNGGGSTGGGELFDNFSLSFAKINYKYKPQDNKGGLGADIELNYDIQQNTKDV